MAEGEWRDVILETIREKASEKAGKEGTGYGLWIVARVRPDNTIHNVTVRSGQYYPNKLTGDKTLPKEGLGYYDFMEIKKLWKAGPETVWELMVKMLDPKHPPVLPAPNAEPPAAPEPEIERMPWDN